MMRTNRGLARKQGMTLLEVLVALAIFAVAGLTLMESSTSHLRNLSHLEQKTMSAWIANDKLNELRLEQIWPELTESKEKVEMAGQTWDVRWQGIKTLDDDMRAIRVTVLQDDGVLAVLQTFVLRPR